jgi:hypothetical protein
MGALRLEDPRNRSKFQRNFGEAKRTNEAFSVEKRFLLSDTI